MLTSKQKKIKRFFDLLFSVLLMIVFWWLIILLFIISCIDNKESGFIFQERIGLNGEVFKILKIKTIKTKNRPIQAEYNKSITKIGFLLRRTKLDELPQIVNVLIGNMSFVGPRPDVKGFADKLKNDDKIILSVKPGITGPASLYFRNEESILDLQENPIKYNLNVIWPKKIELNKKYIKNYSLLLDFKYILQTFLKL